MSKPVPKQQDPRQEYEKLIINRPKVLSHWRRGLEVGATTVGWAVFLFLFRPVMLFLIWSFGFKVFYHHMVELQGIKEFRRFWVIYVIVFLSIVVVIRSWGIYNKAKFGGKERRKFTAPVTFSDVEQHFQLPAETAQKISSWNDVTVDFLSDHQIKIKNGADPSSQEIAGKFISD